MQGAVFFFNHARRTSARWALGRSVAAAARLDGATAARFATAACLATATAVTGGAAGQDPGNDARLAAGRFAAARFATAARLVGASAAWLAGSGATTARLNGTAAGGLAAAGLVGGHSGPQTGEQARLAAGVAARFATAARLAATARLVGAATAWLANIGTAATRLGGTTATAQAEERRSVRRACQCDGDAQRRQQETFHREAPERVGKHASRCRHSPSRASPAPHKGGWRRCDIKRDWQARRCDRHS